MKPIDYSGLRFGYLTALSRAENRGRRRYWLWQCDCGNQKEIMAEHVKSGHTTSCGCRWAEVCVKHGHGHDAKVTRWVMVGDERLCLAEACRRLALNYSTIGARVKNGVPPQTAIEVPIKARVPRAS